MFTRQKLLLGYLLASGGKCQKINLMKGLFYFMQSFPEKKGYDFHPYHYGPYSLIIDLDIKTFVSKGYISEKNNIVSLSLEKPLKKKILDDIESEDFYKLSNISTQINQKDFDSLLDELYKEYPYFAINNQKKNAKYKKFDPRLQKEKQSPEIFTIGYQGVSIDQFFNNLIKNNIHVLVDVRNNPRSMKYGFTESTLSRLCERRNIQYLSFKNLGIPGEFRQELNSQSDYDELFQDFEKNHMPKTTKDLQKLQKLLERGKRIALLCFEKETCQCHRTIVAKHLHSFCQKKHALTHIPTA